MELVHSSGSFSRTRSVTTQQSVQLQASFPPKPSSYKQQQQQQLQPLPVSGQLSSPAKAGGMGGEGFAQWLRPTPTSAPSFQNALMRPAGVQSMQSQAARVPPHTLSPEYGSAVTRPASASLSVSSSSRQLLPPAPGQSQTNSANPSRQHKLT